MHEEPQIPNYGARGRGPKLAPGMTICIARDGKPAAHFENTVLVTEGDPEILTIPTSERNKKSQA